jgi:23S rRNA pseudouridine1911/1915/1917 synthase
MEVRILWSDQDVLAVYKPAGVPVQPDPTGDPDLLSSLRTACNEPSIGLVHRLDRPVSGVMLFSRNEKATATLSAQFRERLVKKTYWAIVEGRFPEDRTLEHVLVHDAKAHKARVKGSTPPDDDVATLHVHVLVQGDRYSLLELTPVGGAFHQIRVQLAAAGFPIKGDVKYGARRGEKDRSIALHARSITFSLPVNNIDQSCQADPPESTIWQVFMAQLANDQRTP